MEELFVDARAAVVGDCREGDDVCAADHRIR